MKTVCNGGYSSMTSILHGFKRHDMTDHEFEAYARRHGGDNWTYHHTGVFTQFISGHNGKVFAVIK